MNGDPSGGRVGEQHAAYRKGLVLGLTMAEVGILIIFVLLLLIAFEAIARDDVFDRFRDKTPVSQERMEQLTEAEATVAEMAGALGIEPTRPKEDFRKLVRALQKLGQTGDGKTLLAEARAAVDEAKKAAETMKQLAAAAAKDAKDGKPDAIEQRLEQQSYRLANQDGQLARYEKQLREAGQGKGERPCWVEPDGTIIFLYDVVLTSDGIRMRERPTPTKTAERAAWPMPETDPAEILSEAEFLKRTAPLYDASVAQNCRFFVVIYDATAEHEKPLYKRLLRTVEGHFYKRLSNASAPF